MSNGPLKEIELKIVQVSLIVYEQNQKVKIRSQNGL